ncbi:MAG: polysulfide reductase NrfD [Chloroflexi bacterium]|nr:polysulfide reductase NrfD [Chloroflexota bacterium]
MTTTTVKPTDRSGAPLPVGSLALLFVALVAIGVAWGVQLSQGLQVTGLSQQVVWGLYIAGFFVAAGAGAGLVLLAALGEFLPALGIARRRSTLLLALAAFVTAGVLIALDLGDPLNSWRIATAGRFTSPMTWDFWTLAAATVLALLYLLAAWKQPAASGATRTLGVLAAVAALLLVVAESAMLAGLAARPLWSGGLTLVSFLVAAAVAALGAGVLAWKGEAARVGRWLGVGLALSLVLVLAEVLGLALSSEPRSTAEAAALLRGEVSPLFWAYVVVGLLLPLALLVGGRGVGRLPVVAGLALLGVVLQKLWLLVAGQAVPWLALPAGRYWPTWVEVVGLLGAAALLAGLYLLLCHLTHLQEG